MEEVQSWWEVPTVAHFCHIFRTAFKIVFFEIAELEVALLNLQDNELGLKLEQIVINILTSCGDDDEITLGNFEDHLIEFFDDNCDDDDDNPLGKNKFNDLTPRSKIIVILRLCEFRLMYEDIQQEIQSIPIEEMRADCVGKDSNGNIYWYFCDERLYKENPSMSSKSKFPNSFKKSSNILSSKKTNGKRKRNTSVKKDESWSIICYNSADWEELVKVLKKNKNKAEKELTNNIESKYLPILSKIAHHKDKELRKRYMEFAPKRMSSRIEKVQAKKKIDEEKAALEQEEKKKKISEQLEKERKEKEFGERSRRAQERELSKIQISEERSKRSQQRSLMRGYDSDSDSSPPARRTSPRASRIATHQSSSSEESSSNESESECDNDDVSNSIKREVNSESESEEAISYKYKSESVMQRVQKRFTKPEVLNNTYDLTKWNSTLATKGSRVHVLSLPYNSVSVPKKRVKIESENYQKQLRDYKENQQHKQGHSVNLRQSTSPAVRFTYLKPVTKNL